MSDTDQSDETPDQRRARRRKEIDDTLLTLRYFTDDIPLKGSQRAHLIAAIDDLQIDIGDERADFARQIAEAGRKLSGRRVLYMAHPVAGDVTANLARAHRWLKWLMAQYPDASIVAPWIPCVVVGNDADPVQRARGLEDCRATAARCDGIILVGGRVSSGMAIERDAAVAAGREVIDYTNLGDEPPGYVPESPFTDAWSNAIASAQRAGVVTSTVTHATGGATRGDSVNATGVVSLDLSDVDEAG